MRITQNYKGKTSHLPHTQGTPKDYPIDDGCSDTGKDYIFCPCDSMTVKRIYGVGESGANTIWLQSDKKVSFADGTRDYFTMLITHPDDKDLKRLYVGQKFNRKEKICREGKDGATANHLHISGGKGKIQGNGWEKNTKGKWVLTVTGSTEKPENLFFIDTDFTKVLSVGGLNFRRLKDVDEDYPKGTYKVNCDLLYVRKGPSTKYAKKAFRELSPLAQKKILTLTDGQEKNGYVRGLSFLVYEVRSGWGRTPSGWVSLRYCEVAE
jgi:hypothetical protein